MEIAQLSSQFTLYAFFDDLLLGGFYKNSLGTLYKNEIVAVLMTTVHPSGVFHIFTVLSRLGFGVIYRYAGIPLGRDI